MRKPGLRALTLTVAAFCAGAVARAQEEPAPPPIPPRPHPGSHIP